jgi:hypothetical protein
MTEKLFVFGIATVMLVGCAATLIWYLFFRPSDKSLAEAWARENGCYILEFRRPKFSETVPKKARTWVEEQTTYVGRIRTKNGRNRTGWFIVGSSWNPFATDNVVRWVDE